MDILLDTFLPPVTDQAIHAERDRRLGVGFDLELPGYGLVGPQGRDTDMAIMLGLKDTARDLKEAGVTAAAIPYRDRHNVDHLLTADQMIQVANAGKLYVQEVYQASWKLKDQDGTPQDFRADKWWPRFETS